MQLQDSNRFLDGTFKLDDTKMECTPFFRILRDILANGKDIIEWTNNGQSIIMRDVLRAEELIFPAYFG